MTSIATVRDRLRRLVMSLPNESDPWHGPHDVGNGLANFQDFTDEEIPILQEFLQEPSLPHDHTMAVINDENCSIPVLQTVTMNGMAMDNL
jgi:hypothetical protein